jgi:HD-GYP domain-containing protein (c-di-GMP phosphodiesterase class II)
MAKGHITGVLEVYHRAPLILDTEWLNFLEALAAQAAIAIDNATLFNELQRSTIEITVAYDATLEGWAHALDLRNRATEQHTKRVMEMTLRLARTMGISEKELVHIRRGSLLHDIGKIGIPDSILLKPGTLTDEEWTLIYKHPQYAFDMLQPIAYLRPALDIPYAHHEKWDGSGYPRSLKGEQIPLAARIFSVADVWDAMTDEQRPYRKALSKDEVREYIRSLAGTQLDPKVVDAFLKMEW